MLLFLYGTELLQPSEKIHALTEKFFAKNQQGADKIVVDCADGATIKDVHDALFSGNLFTRRRLVIVKNPFSLPAKDQRELAMQLKALAHDVVVFWERGSVRANAVLSKALLSCADMKKEYIAPRGNDYYAWAARRLHTIAPGTTLERDAAKVLETHIGDDLVRLHNILMQCASYVDSKCVTVDVVHLFIEARATSNVFKAVEALTRGDRAQALSLLREQLSAGEDAFKLFGLYVYHVRSLLTVAEYSERGVYDYKRIAQKTRLAPFVVSKALAVVRAFPRQRLLCTHAHLVALDRAVKRGVLTMEDALYDFVTKT